VLQGDLTDATMISVSTVQNIMGLIFTLTIFLGMVSQRVYGWGGRGGVLLAGVLVHRLFCKQLIAVAMALGKGCAKPRIYLFA
jgi:hypothetical protein